MYFTLVSVILKYCLFTDIFTNSNKHLTLAIAAGSLKELEYFVTLYLTLKHLLCFLQWHRLNMFLLLNMLFYHSRNLLHHLPMYLCCWYQLWAFPLPTEPVQSTWWHWPWLWLVHVLRMGRPWPHPYCWLLLHLGSFYSTNTQIYLPQVQTGEWHRLLNLAALRRLNPQISNKQNNCSTASSIHWSHFFLCV